jgi:hypothetical protein
VDDEITVVDDLVIDSTYRFEFTVYSDGDLEVDVDDRWDYRFVTSIGSENAKKLRDFLNKNLEWNLEWRQIEWEHLQKIWGRLMRAISDTRSTLLSIAQENDKVLPTQDAIEAAKALALLAIAEQLQTLVALVAIVVGIFLGLTGFGVVWAAFLQ